MRSRTLTGAATAALGAVAVAAAGPALASTPLTQGSALSAPAGACSLTIVDESTAYTAAHCGGAVWEVGSPVRSAEGARIGTVTALPGESGVDLVRIGLAEDVRVVGDWATRPAASVEAGETVYTHGSSVPMGHPNSLSHAHAFDSDAVCADGYADQVALDAATTHPGDSGGAVYDAQQRVVGVISGVAPVTFDEDGEAVSCDAKAMSSIMVPIESTRALDAAKASSATSGKTPRPAPKHAADMPTAGAAPVAESEVTTIPAEEQKEIADELIAKQEAKAAAEKKAVAEKKAATEKKAAAEKKAAKAPAAAKAEAPAKASAPAKAKAKASAPAKAKAKASAPAKATPAPDLTTEVTYTAAEGVARGTRTQITTDEGRFEYMKVYALDADGCVLGEMQLHTVQPMAWINVPADVPAGGSVKVIAVSSADAPADTVVTLGGQRIG